MIQIMSHARWMKYTDGGMTSIRSKELKAIDAAVLRYNNTKATADLDALRLAITAWMDKEGARWKSSIRNKYNAVDDLDKQSRGLPTMITSDEFKAVRNASKDIVDQLFRGKTLDWKPDFFVKLVRDRWNDRPVDWNPKMLSGAGNNRVGVLTNAYSVTTNSLQVAGKASAPQMAKELFHSIVPSEHVVEVSALLAKEMPSFMHEFTASLIPFAGVAVTAGSAVVSAVKTGYYLFQLDDARVHAARSLSVDEPAAAINALIRILERERNYNATSASISTTAFVGKLAGILADGGTATNAAIGLAAGAAKFLNNLKMIVRDVIERSEANKRMQRGGINAEIFEVCPIVGAYLILCVPTSVMVNTVFSHVTEHGWRGDVERTVARHIIPLQSHARNVIANHRFEIVALKNYPGMFAVNENKLAQMQAWKEWRERHPDRAMGHASGPAQG
jgi:hypothetical protein